MPKPIYPPKLLVLDPHWRIEGYRRKLSGLEATLAVELTHDQRFTFAFRDQLKLGPRSYAACLIDFAADLRAGYTVALAEPGDFLDELEALARNHATAAQRDAIEIAALLIAERSRHQIRDVMEGDVHHSIGRCMIMACDPKPKRGRAFQRRYGSDTIGGVPTPRIEQLWKSLKSEWLDVRMAQHAQVAWQQWAQRGRRPTMLNSTLKE